MTKVYSGTSSLDYASECTTAEIILVPPMLKTSGYTAFAPVDYTVDIRSAVFADASFTYTYQNLAQVI